MKKIVFVLAALMGLQGNVFALDCLDEYEPVCGNDGLTYRNSCYMLNYEEDAGARVNSIGIAYHGECLDLTSCASFFDGCNTCAVEGGKITSCTKMACETQKTPSCLKEVESKMAMTTAAPVFAGELSDALKQFVGEIKAVITKMLQDKTADQRTDVYKILDQKIAEKIVAMKDFQTRALFTPEASKTFEQKLRMFEYLHYLIKLELYNK